MRKFSVIFDMDGVIVDSNPFHKKAWKAFFEKHNIYLSEEELKTKVYGRINPEILSHFFPEKSHEEIEAFSQEKEKMYRELIKPTITPVKGLIDFLKLLKNNNISLAVATSAPKENADFVMEELEIKDYFKLIIDASEVKKGKPNPEIYLTAAEKIKTNPENCIVIEDSISGIEAALRGDMKVIAITTTHKKEELKSANLVIENFNELNIKKIQSLFKK